jgi:hypothetical protein
MESQGKASSFAELREQVSVDALQREVEAERLKVRKLVKARDEAEEALQEAQRAYSRRRRLLEALEEFGTSEEAQTHHVMPSNLRPSKRAMATMILDAADDPLYPREVRDIAIERGWLPDTPEAHNQLNVAMAKAVRARKFAKDEEGRYYLPGPEEPRHGKELNLLRPDQSEASS